MESVAKRSSGQFYNKTHATNYTTITATDDDDNLEDSSITLQ
jgi:hypothetical protein